MDKQGEMKIIRGVAEKFPRATLTGPAAARVWGLATLRWATHVDVIPPGKTRAKTPGGENWTYRHGKVDERQVVTIGGVRVTALIVVLFDTYRYHGRLACLVTVESARQKWPELTVDQLLALAQELPRAKGLRGFREVICGSVGTSESALETVVRDIVRTVEGVVILQAQVRFDYAGECGEPRWGRIDLLVNGIVAIECDGRAYHGHDVTPAERYREKQLLNKGMIVLRVGWRDVDSGALPGLLARALRNIEHTPRQRKRGV